MMMIVVARTTRKIFALGGHPPDHIVDDRLCGGTIFKEERVKERVKGRVCLVSFPRRKKKIVLSRLKMFDFFDVSNARERESERKRCPLSLRYRRKKERERALTAEGGRKKKYQQLINNTD